jgi:hypothetical protein
MATAKWEHLTCEYAPKNHAWKRELGIRGRKPRFCEKHRPVVSLSSATTDLHCELGNHDWVRPPTRGRVPTSCPDHRVAKTIVSAPRNENGKVTLHCEIGNHDWERAPQRGRKPTSCPKHSGPRPVAVSLVKGSEEGDKLPSTLGALTEWAAPKKRGRPKIHETPEEAKEAQLEKSRERAANLEGALKERGTHISQQAPYILYKRTGEKPGRKGAPPTVTWDKVTEHSPLAQAQYINSHAKDFDSGAYRYERNGKVVVL